MRKTYCQSLSGETIYRLSRLTFRIKGLKVDKMLGFFKLIKRKMHVIPSPKFFGATLKTKLNCILSKSITKKKSVVLLCKVL